MAEIDKQSEFEKEAFLGILTPDIREKLVEIGNFDKLIEVVLDLGRSPEARFVDKAIFLRDEPITREEIEFVISRVGTFDRDNRAGIERTLHRISAVRNRRGDIVGLTCRVGRAIFGTIDPIKDIIESDKSILLLGKPGVGKTTLLREAARVLSVEQNKRVIVVDTSNEIAGDGDIPHPGIGRARRMQVPFDRAQEDIMIEAVENHFPEVIIIDEIGRTEEAKACRTIAERGVRLIGTAHGTSIENLLVNPTLQDLIGGITAVTLGDEEAGRRGTQKTILERKSPPTFQVLIEIRERGVFAIYHDLAETVDALLRGFPVNPEIRVSKDKGAFESKEESESLLIKKEKSTRLRVFPLAINTSYLERGIHSTRTPVEVVRDLSNADVILTLRRKAEKNIDIIDAANRMNIRVEFIEKNSLKSVKEFLRRVRRISFSEEISLDYDKLEEYVRRAFEENKIVELPPASADVLKEEQAFVSRYGLYSEIVGLEPNRRLVIYPNRSSK
jgi:stage III sporulation protein SpoIIIAA